VAYVSMVVVGLSTGQIAWAILPESKAIGWASVVFFGVLGALAGGLAMGFLLHDARGNPAYFQPVGVVGSMAGTLAVVGLFHLFRRRMA
jgi:uncharacterized membrane protein YeaQ/YmgE (transglycosylase-associated protein family)